MNEIVDDNQAGSRQRYYVHGLSYVDKRLMMYRESATRAYYYLTDRMYNVMALVERAGAIVERYAYDAYGQPLIRESCGRGDMDKDTDIEANDVTTLSDVKNGLAWDARGDMDDDGDVDATDVTLQANKQPAWTPPYGIGSATVAQAFSDVGNPYMFQGVPYFVLDTASNATVEVLPLIHHRARFSDPTTGRWVSRDALLYNNHKADALHGTRQSGLRRSPPFRLHARNGRTLVTEPAGEYLLCDSNPATRADPFGNRPWPIFNLLWRLSEAYCRWEHCRFEILLQMGQLCEIDAGEAGTEIGFDGVHCVFGNPKRGITDPVPGADGKPIVSIPDWDWDFPNWGDAPPFPIRGVIICHNPDPNRWPCVPAHLPSPEEVVLICGPNNDGQGGPGIGVIGDRQGNITYVTCPYRGETCRR